MNKSHNLTLSLIRLFVVLAETKTTTKAGKVLFLSQSAISHNLKKLRTTFEDELFIRTGNRMEMTNKAKLLYPKLKAWLLDLEEIVTPDTFEPATTTDTFVIACSDLFEHMYGPVILRSVYRSAPNAKLKFIKLDANNLVDDVTQLRCDIAISARRIDSSETQSQHLYTDQYGACVNDKHPILQLDKSLDDYLAFPHILSSLNDGKASAVDKSLEKVSRKRNLKYVTFNFSNVPFFIEQSDVIWTAPRRYLEFCQSRHSLAVFPPPVSLEEVKIYMYWSRLNDNSPANIWFRNVLLDVTSH